MVKEIADRYLLKTLIGEGRFGRVYKAKDYRTSKKVAVKIVRIELIYYYKIYVLIKFIDSKLI